MAKAEKKQKSEFDVVLTLSEEEAQYLRYLTGTCVSSSSVHHNGNIYDALCHVVAPSNGFTNRDGSAMRIDMR